MDAIKFINERNRMCGTMSEVWGVDAAQIVKNTEEWSAAHPRKTRQNVFLKQYPNAALDSYGVLEVSPCDIEATLYDYKDCNADDCGGCRREFWSQEVE